MEISRHDFEDRNLELKRCPHCAVATPSLTAVHRFSSDASNGFQLKWCVYVCSRCGRPVIGGCASDQRLLTEIFPKPESISEDIPEKAGVFLAQAMESLHAPSGAIMLCASSIDAMLKAKNLKTGTLYKRIDQAAQENLITEEMGAWAHDIRLDANDERHADDEADLPDINDAKRCIDFVKAFAEFMYVLPARVRRGRKTD
jgi:DNA-directed RNA polymerase subunit RPC12/RpoP